MSRDHSPVRFLFARGAAIALLAAILAGYHSGRAFAADIAQGSTGLQCQEESGPTGPSVLRPDAAFADGGAGLREDRGPGWTAPARGNENAPSAKEEGAEALLDDALDLVEAARELWTHDEEEKSVNALDKAYGLLLKVEGGDPALAGQKESIRLAISRLLAEEYASHHAVAKGNHREIPLTINRYVEREIRVFQGRERRFFLESYRRSGKYRGTIVKALQEAGLPEELSWLPLIESGFKLRARSRAHALGLWQFVPSTGYKYGLKRNRFIDERLDPVKSTKAAIAYLTDLHELFGDWATVLAAYNWGEGRILKEINRQKIDYLDGFWDLFERLPYETARYYPRFLAVLAIMKDPARYGFELEEPDAPFPLKR